MGTLAKSSSEETVVLPARCLVGRTPLAVLHLDHRAASREHAVIEWHHDCWRLRDLGSRNGTTLNGRPCSESFSELTEGDVVAFGASEERWTLVDMGPPPPAAVSEDGTLRVGRGDVLLLPDAEHPALSIEATAEGWIGDDGSRTWLVVGDDLVELGSQRWRLLLPAGGANRTTLQGGIAPHLDHLSATIAFDRTEEHVRVALHHADGAIELPARAHDYLLLVLARARVRDRVELGSSVAEAGWTDSLELSKMLNTTPERINVLVFRARRLLSELAVVDAARIVERRARTRQLRFGIREIRFVPL